MLVIKKQNWMDELFDNLDQMFYAPFPAFASLNKIGAAKIDKEGNTIELCFNVAGVKKHEIKISAEADTINIRAGQFVSYAHSDDKFDFLKSEAKLEDGILTIKAPKINKTVETKEIPIL